MKGMIVHEVNDGVTRGFWQFQFAARSRCSIIYSHLPPVPTPAKCRLHLPLGTAESPLFVDLFAAHLSKPATWVTSTASSLTRMTGGGPTEATSLTSTSVLAFFIFKRCSPSPVLASPVISSFELWISCSSCRVLRFLSFANLGRIAPRVGQISFLVLFDCKMWMENSVPEVKRGL